jgi:CubicO group peptidase (beta-lactamase class C family)
VNHNQFDKLIEDGEIRGVVSTPENNELERAFDDPAKALAKSAVTRRQLLRLLGGAIAGAALASIPVVGCAQQKPPGDVNTSQPRQELTPQWDQVFQEALGDSALGYYYAVAQNGQIVSEGGQHFTRSAQEQQNPGTTWSPGSRINLASVSKSVTAVAYLSLYQAGLLPLTDYFYPYLASRVPAAGPGIDTIKAEDLLSMKSAMVRDGTLKDDLWTFLNAYLQRGLVKGATPGVTYAYSNTNFTILQGLIDLAVSDLPPPQNEPPYTGYVDYVQRAVLTPMGIDTNKFTAKPDARPTATLYYSGADDLTRGHYWPPFSFIAPGGWVANAGELLKFLIGIRNNTVLSPQLTERMFTESLGWYTWNGKYGQYYHHNGGLFDGANPRQGLSTGIVHFTNGYDAVLLTNSPHKGIIKLMVQAFETT